MKTVIEMAREAGEVLNKEWLERFAELVRADEREACAKLCEDEDVASTDDAIGVQLCIAEAIRARSNT